MSILASSDLASFVRMLGGTFSRATIGTYIDGDGVLKTAGVDVPRLGYKSSDLSSRGILIEDASTNLLLRSEAINNATWTKSNVSVTANTAAPDGAITGERIAENTSLSTHFVRQNFTITAGAVVCASMFVQAVGRSKLRFRIDDAATGSNRFDADFDLALVTAGLVTPAGSATSLFAGIEAFANNWFRIWSVGTVGGTSTSVRVWLFLRDTAGATNYTGDGLSGVYAWGAQAETGKHAPSSYIVTTTATVTRAADIFNLVSALWENEAEGTLFVEFTPRQAAATVIVASLANSASPNSDRHFVRLTSGMVPSGRTEVGGASQAALDAAAIAAFSTVKIAYSFKANSFRGACNGVALTEDTSGSLPAFDRFYIGNSNGASQLNGWIKNIVFFRSQLTQAELNALTA